MNVDIYIRERNGTREIRVPWLPEEIQYDSGGVTMASYSIMNKGEVAVPTGSGLASYSWSSEFPGEYRTDDSMMRGTWKEPKTYHNILEDWQNNRTPLHLLVTGYPINKDVLLKNYKGTASGGFGDWTYDVEFIEDREIVIESTKVESPVTTRPATTPTTYTIKKGDTLWAIAKKLLGSGAKWTTIYNANKTIIEHTANKYRNGKGSNNGHWIYPGTVLTISGATGTGAGAGTGSKKKYTLTIVNKGASEYWGTYALYFTGDTQNQLVVNNNNQEKRSVTLVAGAKAKIVPKAKSGYAYSLSTQEVTMTKDTTVNIVWLAKGSGAR